MSNLSKRCYLLMSASSDPENTTRIELVTDVTCFGRPEADQVGPSYIDLQVTSVSRRHARIVRQGDTYVLENWAGRANIGIYERSLHIGETHKLRHCDIFRIPDIESPHLRLVFLAGNDTRFLPLEVEQQRPVVRVFGEEVRFTPLEHRLLAFLYLRAGQLCRYEDIIQYLWPDALDQKVLLEELLADIRNKILPASGGFSFMETFSGEGVRLVI
jgi:hypothetical protein